MRFFFDTNILVYANTVDKRREKAADLLSNGGFISAQVLNECANVFRKKQGKNWQEIEEAIADILAVVIDIIPLDLVLNQAALKVAQDVNVSFYDALIIAAAQAANCSRLYSEDMQHGHKIGNLTIINPFLQ